MCMMCDGMSDEQILAMICEHIDRVGWSAVFVEGAPGWPAFAYTVGLTRFHGHPELVVSGLDEVAARDVLDDLAAQVRDGRRLVAGQSLDRDELGQECLMVQVADPSRLALAQEVYGSAAGWVPALQVVWATSDGRWPWQRTIGPCRQEVLGAPDPRAAA